MFTYPVFSGVTSAETLIFDDFVDSDGTALTAHTPDIDTVGTGWQNGWTDAGGNHQITDTGINVYANSANLINTSLSYIDCGETAKRVIANGYHPPTPFMWLGVVLRHAANDDFVFLRARHDSPYLQLIKSTGYSYTTLDTNTAARPSGQNIKFDITDDGTNIDATITIGGVDYSLSASDSTYGTSTNVGLYFYKGSSYMNDFLVETI